MRISRPKSTRRPRKARAPRARMPRRLARRGDVPDVAGCSVTTNFNGLTTNQTYSSLTTQLSDFSRAVTVGQAYQFYRIKMIEFKFLPKLDTYVAGGAGGATLPQLLYMIDKSGAIPTSFNAGNLLQMGAKPIRFDDKNITVKWRPSVLTDVAFNQGGAAGASAPSQYKISPWLATNQNSTSAAAWAPSLVNHLGIHWVVETSGANSLYDLIVTAHFEFKKPLVQVQEGQAAAVDLGSLRDVSGNIVG